MIDNNLPVSSSRPFFIPGGTLPGNAPSYVTRQADHDLLEGLRGGQFCYVLTSRQMGKSSLMVRIANRLREEGVAVAILDLTALGQNLSVEQWYYGLLEQLGRNLRLEDELDDYWQSHKGLGPMQRWMAAIRDVVLCHRSNQVTVFVDEIDIVRSLPFSTDEFFAAIRECYNRRAQEPQYEQLTFCLLGVATPSDLIRDTLMTPFNIGRRIELTDFALKEAATLSVGISVTDRDGRALLSRVLYWTGGHPYLTQRLCASVAEDTAALREEDVDELCADLFLAHKARESDDNLQFVRNRLLRGEVDLTALLDLYSRVRQDARVADDETNVLTSVLKLSGIMRVERGELKVRNRIYERVFDRDWVRENMPDAETRRQRAAVMKARWQVGSIAAAILLFMGGLMTWAVRNSLLAERARKAESAARKAYEGQSLEAQRQAGLAMSARNEAEGALKNESAAKAAAQRSAAEAQRLAWVALSAKNRVERAAAAERTLSALAQQHRRQAERTAYFADMKLISAAYDAKQFDRIGGLLDETKQEKYRPYRSFEWGYWNRLRRLHLLTLNRDTGENIEVASSPDGMRAVTWTDRNDKSAFDETAKVWDAQTGRQLLTLKGHTDKINSADFSPDGQRIVTGSSDNTAKVWEVQTGRNLLTLKGPYLHVASDDSQPPRPLIGWVAFSPDGTRIVANSYVSYQPDRKLDQVHVWDAHSGRQILTLKGQHLDVNSVVFSPDCRMIVTIDSTIEDRKDGEEHPKSVWDAQTGRRILTLKGRDVAVAFSPDGKRMVTGSDLSAAKVWDTRTGRQILALKEGLVHRPFLMADVHRVFVFSPDGTRIVTNSYDTSKVWENDRMRVAKVWDAQTGQQILTLKGHRYSVDSIAYSPDGKRIVTGSEDTTAKVWDARTGKEIVTLMLGRPNEGISAVAFSPDGQRIVMGSLDGQGGGGAGVWDAQTGREILDMPINAEVGSVGFSPDGKRIVECGRGRVHVWFSDPID